MMYPDSCPNILWLGYKPKNHHYSNDLFFYEAIKSLAKVDFISLVNKAPYKVDALLEKRFKKKYDLVLVYYMGSDFDLMKIRPLSDFGVPTVFAAGDCHTRLYDPEELLFKISAHHKFSHLAINNLSTRPFFKERLGSNVEIIHMPWSYNPKIHKPGSKRNVFDVVIPAGNFSIPIRKRAHEVLSSAAINYSDIFYKARRGSISPKKYSKIIYSSKIAVSTCQRDDMQYYNDHFIGMTFNKYFEFPAINTFHLAQRSADAEIFGFVDGKNIAMFDTVEEMYDKALFYLKNDNVLQKITMNGNEHVTKNRFTYADRAKDFLDLVIF